MSGRNEPPHDAAPTPRLDRGPIAGRAGGLPPAPTALEKRIAGLVTGLVVLAVIAIPILIVWRLCGVGQGTLRLVVWMSCSAAWSYMLVGLFLTGKVKPTIPNFALGLWIAVVAAFSPLLEKVICE